MTALTLTHGNSRRMWLFTLDMTGAEVAALLHPAPAFYPEPLLDLPPNPQADLLGVDYVDEDFVEIFDLANLAGLGLAEYLITGNGIPEAQVVPDRARLDALQGHVLILFEAAISDWPVTLNPDPRLTLIGSYAEETPPVQFEPLPDADAKGSLGAAIAAPDAQQPGVADPLPAPQFDTAEPPPPAQKYSNARMSGMVATFALLVMFAMVGLLIWIA